MHTEAQFTAAMVRAVAKRGADFRYPTRDQDPGGFYLRGSAGGSQPTYSTPNGVATCLIGCAMQEAGMMVPSYTERGSAQSVLYDKVPTNVALAARVAQIHQDYNHLWGEALTMYKEALALMGNEQYSPHSANTIYLKTAERLGIPVKNRARMEMGYYGGVIDISELSKPMSSYAQAAAELDAAAAAFSEVMTELNGSLTDLVSAPKATEKVYPTSGSVFANGGIISGGWITPSEAIYSMSGQSIFTTSPEPMHHWVGATKKEHALTA